jgi:hypothetical protein
MIEDKIDKKIKLSYDLHMAIIIVGVIVSVWIFATGLYGLLNLDFSIFNIISLIVLIFAIFALDHLLHLANAEIDDDFIYLKGLFFSKKIDLRHIDLIKQKLRLRKNYEPLILIKTNDSEHFIKRYYIIPNNVSFDKKVDNKIFNLLYEYIYKVKNNAR